MAFITRYLSWKEYKIASTRFIFYSESNGRFQKINQRKQTSMVSLRKMCFPAAWIMCFITKAIDGYTLSSTNITFCLQLFFLLYFRKSYNDIKTKINNSFWISGAFFSSHKSKSTESVCKLQKCISRKSGLTNGNKYLDHITDANERI